MRACDALSDAILGSGVTKSELARMAGRSPQYVHNVTKGLTGMSINVLAELADAVGYRLVLVPADERLPRGARIIDQS